MRNVGGILLCALALLLAALGNAGAQSIKVAPANSSVPVNKTLQFSAQVTGLSSADVIWSAGGVKGGNATAGTITPAGLYTAGRYQEYRAASEAPDASRERAPPHQAPQEASSRLG